MTTKERILKLIKSIGTTKAIFMQRTGIKRGFLDGDKLEASVSDKQLAAILAAYPDVNLEWLVTGHGSQYKTTTQQAIQPQQSNQQDLYKILLDKYEKKVEECTLLRAQLQTQRTNN